VTRVPTRPFFGDTLVSTPGSRYTHASLAVMTAPEEDTMTTSPRVSSLGPCCAITLTDDVSSPTIFAVTPPRVTQ
jgi:hypothetical protein